MLPAHQRPVESELEIEVDVDASVGDSLDMVLELDSGDLQVVDEGDEDLASTREVPPPSGTLRAMRPSVPPPLPPRASMPSIPPLPLPDKTLLEEQSREIPGTRPEPRASFPSLRLGDTPMPSRRRVDEKVVEDVTGQCLATIAEVTSRTRIPMSLTESILAVPLRPRPVEEPEEETAQNPASSVNPFLTPSKSRSKASESKIRRKLPSVTAPPFVRRSSSSMLPTEPGSAVVPRFVTPPAASSTAIAMTADARVRTTSDAPVSLSARPEPTVVVVREPPRAHWVAVAAIIGAAAAIGGMRVAAPSRTTPVEPPRAVATMQAPPTTPTSIAVAPAPAKPEAPARDADRVVTFDDAQAVAVPAKPHASVAPHVAPKVAAAATTASPAKTSKVPPPQKLPDGTYNLARTDAPPKEAPAPATPPPAAAPPTKTPRVLTPEQQLVEAQLKASMK